MKSNINIPGLSKLKKDLDTMNKDSEIVVKRTISDFKSRAPAWVGAAVTKTYGISKGDVKGAFKGVKKGIGSIKVSGVEVENMGLVYEGRTLTPTHFKMKPTSPPKKRPAPYQITAEIFKGKRLRLSRHAFLATNRGGGYIPFQREGAARYPIKAIKTVSIPQMLGNETVSKDIMENIETGLEKRVVHHLEQILKKKS